MNVPANSYRQSTCQPANPRLSLFGNGQIACYGVIDDAMAQSLLDQIFYLDHEHPGKEIVINVNSPGGSVSAGLAIIDAMAMVSGDVRTIGIGTVASMASVILASGTPGKRAATPHSEIMIHQIIGAASGQQTDIEIQARRCKMQRQQLDELLAKATGKSASEISAATERDCWLAPKEAMEFGLIDTVIYPAKNGDI